MTYKEFTERICQMVTERVTDGMEVMITHALKNNKNQTDNLTIMRKEDNFAPAVCLNTCYEQYQSGTSIDRIVEQILACFHNENRYGVFDISWYTDFEKVKGQIACKLINYKKNRYILTQVPHRRFLNLAIVFFYKFEHPLIGNASILIQNAHMELWNTDLWTLQSTAEDNTLRLLPYRFLEIEEVVPQIKESGIAPDFEVQNGMKLYILTNTEQFFGAVNIIYESVLERIYQKLGCNFFVLPSSIHECMILPVESRFSAEHLKEMVQEINDEYVDESEILSDSVYFYDGCEKKLRIAVE